MACHQPLSSLLALMSAYREELNYTVLSNLISVISQLSDDYLCFFFKGDLQFQSFLFIMQISYKVARIVADAAPELLNDIKLFFINLFQYSAEYVPQLLCTFSHPEKNGTKFR